MADIAGRCYEAGEIILTCERPLVQCTKYEHRPFTCDHCMKKVESSTACPVCRKVYYCSTKCLADNFETVHQYECDIFAKRAPMKFETNGYDYLQRLTLRLYLLVQRDPEALDRKFVLHNGKTRSLAEMESHSAEIVDTPQFKGILNYFLFYEINDYDQELLLRCYGILQVNSFGIDCYDGADDNGRDVMIESRGSGLYVEASVFDHDCCANACASGDGLWLEIRALRRIEIGEPITIDYLQDVLPREERRQQLSDRYFFTCQCPLGCRDELAPEQRFDSKVDYKRLDVLNRVIAALMSSFAQNPDENSAAGQLALLMRAQSSKLDFSRLLDCWRKRLDLQVEFYSQAVHHPCMSLFYREFLLLNLYLVGQQEEAQQQNSTGASGKADSGLDKQSLERDIVVYGEKARQHLKITHGEQHVFYAKLFSRLPQQ